VNTHFKITQQLRTTMLTDLARPHEFAAERVGFISCRAAYTATGLLVLAESFHPVADQDYLHDVTVGAMMGTDAIRKALELAYNTGSAMAHVHCHDHKGRTWFSSIDLGESAKFIPDFFKVCPTMPHATIVLSRDSAAGLCWTARAAKPQVITKISFVGSPLEAIWAAAD
jgi:hypothetical protein